MTEPADGCRYVLFLFVSLLCMSHFGRKISGIVLAGGKSSRMGEDKGLMNLGGKPMVVHVIDQVRPWVDEMIIIANKPGYEQFGYQVVPDLVEAAGPAGGIYTGLTVSLTDLNFFAGCDMPFITGEAIRYMLAEQDDAEISVASLGGRMQPLFGVYSRNCKSFFEDSIRKGNLKLQTLVRQCIHKLVALDALAAQHPHLLHNINSPQEFDLALKQIKSPE